MRKIPAPYTDPTPLFRHGGGPPGLLDFSASINPLGPPKSVLRAIKEGLVDIGQYPDPDCRELTIRLAAEHHVEPSQIVVGNGSNELIYAIARALRPKSVAIAEPTYTEYLRASLLVGAKVDHWLAEGNHFKLKPFDPQGADLVWLCNPNNPTGQLWTRGEHLATWIRSFPQTLFVVDEAFIPLCVSEHVPTLLPHLSGLANLIILRSMTKLYALPGLRLGYALASPQLARRLQRQLVPWSVNVLAQLAGCAALGDDDYLERTRTTLPRQVHSFCFSLASLRDFGQMDLLPTDTNFVLVRLKKTTAASLADRLAQVGIRIRNASNFVGLDDRYVRLAVHNQEDFGRLFVEWPLIFEKDDRWPAPS